MNNYELQEFADGALQENFNKAFEQVLKNMLDPNTPYKNKRVITIKIGFIQNEMRDDSRCEISVETKLAPVAPVATNFAIGNDLRTGEVMAREYGKQIKGQMKIDDFIDDEERNYDLDTGEILETEDRNDNVINLRKARV